MSRRCWRYALAGAVAVVGLASIATDTQAERVRWKLHAAYASNIPIIGDTPTMMIDTVDKASGGEFKIKHFEPGAVQARRVVVLEQQPQPRRLVGKHQHRVLLV